MDIKDVEITIGSDPEFAIVCGDSLENVLEILSRLLKEEYQCVEREFGSERSYFCTTEIGCDGSRVIGELRPGFSSDPIEHFKNILNLIKRLYKLLYKDDICKYSERVSVISGSYIKDRPLGGHIHFGYNKNVFFRHHNFITKNSYVDVMKLINMLFSDVLSFYVGIPMFLIEDIEEGIKRREKKYGYFGSYEKKEHGIEFRMPSSWIVSPEIAIGAITLAYTTFYEIYTTVVNNLRNLSINEIRNIIDDNFYKNVKKEVNIVIQIFVKGIEEQHSFTVSQVNADNLLEDDFINGLVNIILYNVEEDDIRSSIIKFIEHNYKPKEVDKHDTDISFWYYHVILDNMVNFIVAIYYKTLRLIIMRLLTSDSVIYDIYKDFLVFFIKEEFNNKIYKHVTHPSSKYAEDIISFLTILYDKTDEIIYPHVKKFKLYNKYSDYIDTIFEIVKHGNIWPTDDIIPRWKELF